jgi:hypothetical protein
MFRHLIALIELCKGNTFSDFRRVFFGSMAKEITNRRKLAAKTADYLLAPLSAVFVAQ